MSYYCHFLDIIHPHLNININLFYLNIVNNYIIMGQQQTRLKNGLSNSTIHNLNPKNIITHQNILKLRTVPFYNSIQISQLPTLYMENPGDSLATLINQRKGTPKLFTEEDVIKLIESVLYALAYLQTKDIVYIDLRPQNIFYSIEEGSFKLFPSELLEKSTYEGVLLRKRFSPLAPQLLIGIRCQQNQIEPQIYNKANVFTFGMILMEMICLKQSCECYQQDSMQILDSVINERMQMIRQLYSQKIYKIVALMLEYDYSKRFGLKDMAIIINKQFNHANLLRNTNRIILGKSKIIGKPFIGDNLQSPIDNKIKTNNFYNKNPVQYNQINTTVNKKSSLNSVYQFAEQQKESHFYQQNQQNNKLPKKQSRYQQRVNRIFDDKIPQQNYKRVSKSPTVNNKNKSQIFSKQINNQIQYYPQQNQNQVQGHRYKQKQDSLIRNPVKYSRNQIAYQQQPERIYNHNYQQTYYQQQNNNQDNSQNYQKKYQNFNNYQHPATFNERQSRQQLKPQQSLNYRPKQQFPNYNQVNQPINQANPKYNPNIIANQNSQSSIYSRNSYMQQGKLLQNNPYINANNNRIFDAKNPLNSRIKIEHKPYNRHTQSIQDVQESYQQASRNYGGKQKGRQQKQIMNYEQKYKQQNQNNSQIQQLNGETQGKYPNNNIYRRNYDYGEQKAVQSRSPNKINLINTPIQEPKFSYPGQQRQSSPIKKSPNLLINNNNINTNYNAQEPVEYYPQRIIEQQSAQDQSISRIKEQIQKSRRLIQEFQKNENNSQQNTNKSGLGNSATGYRRVPAE